VSSGLRLESRSARRREHHQRQPRIGGTRPRGGDTSDGVVPRVPRDAWRSLFTPTTGSRRWRARPSATHVPTPLVSRASYSHSTLPLPSLFRLLAVVALSTVPSSPGKFSMCVLKLLFNLSSMRRLSFKLEISVSSNPSYCMCVHDDRSMSGTASPYSALSSRLRS
jgi:hypothetical protein